MIEVLLKVKREIGFTVWWAHHSLFFYHGLCPFCDFLLGLVVDVSAEGFLFRDLRHLD